MNVADSGTYQQAEASLNWFGNVLVSSNVKKIIILGFHINYLQFLFSRSIQFLFLGVSGYIQMALSQSGSEFLVLFMPTAMQSSLFLVQEELVKLTYNACIPVQKKMPIKMPFIHLSVRSQAFWTDLPTLTTVGSQLNKAIQQFHDCILRKIQPPKGMVGLIPSYLG